jgi:hypothetical protein
MLREMSEHPKRLIDRLPGDSCREPTANLYPEKPSILGTKVLARYAYGSYVTSLYDLLGGLIMIAHV